MSVIDDQQFCLRWNNFQANITSQFETLRDEEDFTDVTIACEGQRLQAHKVVLSACSPFFKELFKSNPCAHPIIFMRDVEAQHIVALMEFMYAGEVNVAQAHLSTFLKTAESLKIRGLTDTSSSSAEPYKEKDEGATFTNPKPSSSKHHLSTSYMTKQRLKSQISSTSTVTSSQDLPACSEKPSSPPPKRQCKNDHIETELSRLRELTNEESILANHFASQSDDRNIGVDISKSPVHPKVELPDYLSDEDRDEAVSFFHSPEASELPGGMEIIPQTPSTFLKEAALDSNADVLRSFKRRNSGSWSPSRIIENFGGFSNNNGKYTNQSNEYTSNRPLRNRLVKLGDGIEIYEDQLRSVKWSDYRKLTRGLATILFSPAELATCSVTGQRWSRAGTGERPVKPALNKAKVQAIISYVATRFPMVEISRIKQVLAYKCKENSTALKMKAVRYYNTPTREANK